MYENGEVFYRAIPENQLDDLIKTGKIQAGTETFIKYIKQKGYEGVIIKFHMEKGTLDELKKIGTVKKSDKGSLRMRDFGDMPINEKGWLNEKTLFKIEKEQVNIGLGRGKGLDMFNENIVEFEIIK